MSVEASEIVSALTTSLKLHIESLHAQTVNDVSALLAKQQTHLLVIEQAITELTARVSQLEAQNEASNQP